MVRKRLFGRERHARSGARRERDSFSYCPGMRRACRRTTYVCRIAARERALKAFEASVIRQDKGGGERSATCASLQRSGEAGHSFSAIGAIAGVAQPRHDEGLLV